MMNEPPIGRVRSLNEPPTGANPETKPTEPAPAPAPEADPGRSLQEPPAAPSPTPPASRPTFAPPPAAGPSHPAPAPAPPRRDADEPPARRRQQDIDADLDVALDQAMGRRRGTEDVNFKRQTDAEIDAELDAMMAGFDPDTLNVSSPRRTRAEDRAHVPKQGVGQEERQGLQKAKVVGIRGETIFLDLGAKSEGVVPADQFGAEIPNVGDFVEVVFDRYDANEGLLIMSRKGAAAIATWENLHRGMIVEARVVKEIKGGIEVEVNGIRGFMPISQIELGRVESAAEYVNQKLRALVTEVNQRERNLVVSRRELLEQERAEQREKTWAELEEGQVREGVVRSVKPFGAFVDLGGVDGLLPVGELGWHRVNDPSEVVSMGQTVQVKVLRIDRENQKLTLSLKQLLASPWDDLDERVCDRPDRPRQGDEADGLRRLRRAGTRHRRAHPHQRAGSQEGLPGQGRRPAGPGS